MSLVIGIDQVVVVLVDLGWGELALVHDVLIGEGAQIEPVVQPDGVRGTLAKDIELPLEVTLVKIPLVRQLGLPAGSIGGLEHDEGLQDERLAGSGSGAEEGRVHRRLSPAQDP